MTTPARAAIQNLQRQLTILEAELENGGPWLDKPSVYEPLDTKLMSWKAFDAVQSLIESTNVLEVDFQVIAGSVDVLSLFLSVYLHAFSHQDCQYAQWNL